MWKPKKEEEILEALASGLVEETAIFDGKREIPSKSIETAKDIAAMSCDGGVIIYGIDEDENKLLTIATPFPLAGQPERIDNIVKTCIQESPEVVIYTVPTKADPSVGYIVVVVPPSERAPHMVIVNGNNRFYGRGAKGNKPLSEGEVARLYERRQRLQVNLDKLLEDEIGRAPLTSYVAALHIIAQPVFRSEFFLERAQKQDESTISLLNRCISFASQREVYETQVYAPDFFSMSPSWRHKADGYLTNPYTGQPIVDEDYNSSLLLKIDFDGTGHLFCGRAGYILNQVSLFDPYITIGNTTRFFAYMGKLYESAKYYGMVNIGIGVTGLLGLVPKTDDRIVKSFAKVYDENVYIKTGQVSALIFSDGYSLAERMLAPLMNAMTQGRQNFFVPGMKGS